MVSNNRIENVAIVGAGGQVGAYIVDALLQTGKHKVTAISRADSKSTFKEGVQVARVDYDNLDSIVEALRGQDVLVVTMNVFAPPETHAKLIDAAAKAGVPYILPNWWGPDLSNHKMGVESFIGEKSEKLCKQIQDTGVSKWIAVCCGFWYEYSLAGSSTRYGFDIPNRKVTFFDDGNEKISTSTWLQTGRIVASLLSLKIKPDGAEDKEPTLSKYEDSYLFASSFHICQRDMFESLKRVTGTSDSDWTVEQENSKARYEDAVKAMREGKPYGYPTAMYTRVLFPTGEGSFESRKQNAVLNLPNEDLDEATKRAIELFKE